MLDVLGLNLVTVTVALPGNVLGAVETTKLGVLRVGLEDGRAEAETHGSTHVRLRDLGHETDDGVGGILDKLRRVCVLQPDNVTGPLDHSDLESQTNAEEGYLLLTSPLGGDNHALGTTDSEAAGNNDALGRAEVAPRVVVADRVLSLHLRFERGRVNPLGVSVTASGQESDT